jgi:hypothetical protein
LWWRCLWRFRIWEGSDPYLSCLIVAGIKAVGTNDNQWRVPSRGSRVVEGCDVDAVKLGWPAEAGGLQYQRWVGVG